MHIYFLFFTIFFYSSTYAFESMVIKGSGFQNQLELSRELKSQYDLIEKKWSYFDNTIELEAYVSDYNVSKIPKNIEKKEKNKIGFLKKEYIPYINYGTPAVFALYGALFWDWGNMNGFNFKSEGWFGKNTYAGGTDKFAHMYSHYLLNRVSYNVYRNAGLSHDSALRDSFILSSSVGLLIEVGDALSHYGFSFEDIISDFAGIGLGYLLNSDAYLNELIGFQLWWWNNASEANHKGHKFKDPIDDYNNQKYIFNVRLAAIPTLRELWIPKYINFDLGYFSRGYKGVNANSNLTRRELFTGFSLNLPQLLRDLFPNSGYSYHASNFFEYFQPPGTGLEIKSWEDRD